MNRTGKRRLLKLADMLEADAKNKKGVHFNLSTVVAKTDPENYSGFACHVPEDFSPEISCGTTACAMGLAAISGAFKRAGLSYKYDSSNQLIVTTWNGRFKEYDAAAVVLFGITKDEANYLFTPSYYSEKVADSWGDHPMSKVRGAKGERRVANRIRKFVAGEIDITDKKSLTV